MKKIFFVLLVVLLSGFFSCKKTENTSVKVNLVSGYPPQPAPFSKVCLYEVSHKFLNTDAKIINSAITNANGQADFGTFETYRSSKYYYYVVNSTSWIGFNYDDGGNIKKGETNIINLRTE